jgi:hypothetical protein
MALVLFSGGATGYGVRMLVELATRLAGSKRP